MTTKLFKDAVEDFGSPVGLNTLHCRSWEAGYGNCFGCMYEIGCHKYLTMLQEIHKLNVGMSRRKFRRRMRGILFAKNEEQLRAVTR